MFSFLTKRSASAGANDVVTQLHPGVLSRHQVTLERKRKEEADIHDERKKQWEEEKKAFQAELAALREQRDLLRACREKKQQDETALDSPRRLGRSGQSSAAAAYPSSEQSQQRRAAPTSSPPPPLPHNGWEETSRDLLLPLPSTMGSDSLGANASAFKASPTMSAESLRAKVPWAISSESRGADASTSRALPTNISSGAPRPFSSIFFGPSKAPAAPATKINTPTPTAVKSGTLPPRVAPAGRGKTLIGCVVVISFATYTLWNMQPKPFLTMSSKVPWAWGATSFCYFYKVAQDTREQVKDFYWAKSVALTVVAGLGGGFIAPLMVCHTPAPLMEESLLWMAVAAWYLVHHVPMANFLIEWVWNSPPGQLLSHVCLAIFKANLIASGIELAENAVHAEELIAHSRRFQLPLAAPLICGFLSGCGEAFVPYEKALLPFEKGRNWPVRSSFLAALGYILATRFLGVQKLHAKVCCAIFRALGDIFPTGRDMVLDPVTQLLHDTLEVRLK